MSSESHQVCLDGRVAIEMDEVNSKMDPMGRAIADYHKTGTADIKDLYVDDKPFLALIASLLKKGVEVRLIHAKEPGTAWREDHEKHPILYDGMEREAGILTDDPKMLDAAIEQFNNVWIGKFCKECGRREYCADPILVFVLQVLT